jgi:hypothetical protein
MVTLRDSRRNMSKMSLYRAVIGAGVVHVLFWASGCSGLQPPEPHKMYNGPELDKSEVVVISGDVRPSLTPLSGDHYFYIACVDGNCSEGDCAKSLTGWNQVSVLPGKHVITMCYRWRRVQRHGPDDMFFGSIQADMITASPSFELNAEKYTSYWVRLEPPQPGDNKPLSYWVEDMRTRTKVPVRRIE